MCINTEITIHLTPQYNWNIVESGVKHHKSNQANQPTFYRQCTVKCIVISVLIHIYYIYTHVLLEDSINLIAIIPIVQDLACHDRIFKILTLFYTYNVYEDKKHISIRFVHIRFKDWWHLYNQTNTI
jgi:hypothetical protein